MRIGRNKSPSRIWSLSTLRALELKSSYLALATLRYHKTSLGDLNVAFHVFIRRITRQISSFIRNLLPRKARGHFSALKSTFSASISDPQLWTNKIIML